MKDDKTLKAESPHAVLAETGTAFDPGAQHLDLSKEEKRRTTALMMAIQGYEHLIIKDAEMLREVANQERSNEGLKIQAATIDGIVEAAIKFDRFIAGEYSEDTGQRVGATAETPLVEQS